MAIQPTTTTNWETLKQGSQDTLHSLGEILPSPMRVMSSVRSVLETIKEVTHKATHPETIEMLGSSYLNHRLNAWENQDPNNLENRSEAKRIILEYLKNPTEKLSLKDLPVTSLPEIFTFEPFKSTIKSLDLHGTALPSLPESISGLIHLEELDLSDTQMQYIQESNGSFGISSATQASKGSFDVSSVTRFLPSSARIILSIKSALTTACAVKHPETIPMLGTAYINSRLNTWEKQDPNNLENRGEAKKIILEYLKNPTQELKLTNIPITSLPEIFCFEPFKSTLTILDLHGTSLQSLPESIKSLWLFDLNLSNTQIQSFPESIENSMGLWHLNLSNTPLQSLPESISKLTSLRFLLLTNTQIRSLPESIGKLEHLFELDIAHTQIRSLPESIKILRKLREVGLKGCNLSDEVLDEIRALTQAYKPPTHSPSEPPSLLDKLREFAIEITTTHDHKISQARDHAMHQLHHHSTPPSLEESLPMDVSNSHKRSGDDLASSSKYSKLEDNL